MDDVYLQQLEVVRARLAAAADHVEIRGDGASRFVYGENRGRAVEVSQDGDKVCVEFWERNAEFESHQALYASFDQAAGAALMWLSS